MHSLFLAAFIALAFGNAVSAQALQTMLETGVTQVAAGNVHTCALTTAGGVQCWGRNSNGQLGDGSLTDRLAPVAVSGLASGVAQIATGALHSCALTTAGGVQCWGNNGNGQLGDGTTTFSPTPVAVSGLASGVAQITAGEQHTCALTTAGSVRCWGYNASGQLGDGSVTRRLTPAAVSSLASGVAQIAAGWNHSCALTTTGGAQCWGDNASGQLGDGSTTNRLTPVAVSDLASGIAQIAPGGVHTCARSTAGGVKCWGYNGYGELGDDSTIDSLTPVDVSGLASGTAQISAGSFHTCALVSAGGAQCWGYNGAGHIGDGSTTSRPAPVTVSGLASGVAQVSAGHYQTCALSTAGGVQCWGDNTFGQVGDGSTTNRYTPVAVIGLASGVAQIAAGSGHTCALTTGGGVMCWGQNTDGQLGDGSQTNRLTPVAVSGLASGVVQIAGGGFHTCALTKAGGVLCWGRNVAGQLGDNSTSGRTTPVAVSGLASGVAEIVAGNLHTCARTTGGGVLCWGYNDSGQLGDGSAPDHPVPVAVSGLASGATQITAGNYHSCALTSGGGVLCWGRNFDGQLGDNSATNRTTPVAVSGLASGVAQIKAGSYHSCALTTTGGLQCWGDNFYGQLGDTTTTTRQTPVPVNGFASGVAEIAAGGRHSCARTVAGGAQCWGYNFNGQLGDGTASQRLTPVAVSGLASGVAQLTAGQFHTCMRNTAGGVQCWGNNTNGQIGDGTTIERRTPMRVRAGQTISFTPPLSVIVATPFTLTATASSGFTPAFDTWTPGTCSVTAGGTVTATNPALCGIRVSQAGSNSYARASQKLVLLRVRATYAIATAADPVAGGSVSCTPNPVVQDDSANCTQTPNAGYTFTGWSGDCSGTGACSLVNVTAPRSVTANYTLNTYAITVAASPMAGGTANCTPNPVAHGSNASCTQTANTGYTFSGWSGDCTGTGACSLNNVTAARTVTANYTLNSYSITTAANPVAGGTVTCTPNPVIHGTNASCTQTPAAGHTFTGWSGDCAGTGACDLTNVMATSSVTANYSLNSYAIATAADPAAAGTVVCTPNPVSHGSNAECTQTPNAGYLFNGWIGDCAGTGACNLSSVSAAKTVTASYLHEPTLNVDGSATTAYHAGTDGVLLLRYLLGVRGPALTAGALGGDAQRNATQIEAHIASNLMLFDVDGDGNVTALTDGLLIIRRLLGLSGAALVDGARNGSRSDTDIANAIDLLRP